MLAPLRVPLVLAPLREPLVLAPLRAPLGAAPLGDAPAAKAPSAEDPFSTTPGAPLMVEPVMDAPRPSRCGPAPLPLCVAPSALGTAPLLPLSDRISNSSPFRSSSTTRSAADCANGHGGNSGMDAARPDGQTCCSHLLRQQGLCGQHTSRVTRA